MNAKKTFIFMTMLGALNLTMFSQPLKMKVWPNGIPGSINATDYIEKTSGGNGEIIRVEKVTEPEISVFLPSKIKPTGTAVLIIPGGGYGIVAIDHEGYAIAKWLNDQGIAGIVLKYRLPSDLIMTDKTVGPLQDAQEAMRIIRENAVKWKIDPKKVGVIGFSAGGHLAATLSTHYNDNVYKVRGNASARPDFSLLIYPVISFDATVTHMGSRNNLIGEQPSETLVNKFSNELQVASGTPPAFLVHSTDDDVVPVKNSLLYYEALQKNKIAVELHLFQKGGHGYGLAANRGTESQWPALCLAWLKAAGF